MDTSLVILCLITFFIGFFAVIWCILSTCLGVPVRQHIRQLDFSPRGILDAVVYNAPQARDARRKQEMYDSRSSFGFNTNRAGGAARRMGEDDDSTFGGENSYEMMGTGRPSQIRRGL